MTDGREKNVTISVEHLHKKGDKVLPKHTLKDALVMQINRES
jgi:hypothetical protein